MRLRERVQVLNWVIFIIESGTNSPSYYYWVECLLLVLSHAGETRYTSTASTAITHWSWVEQTVRHTTQALHLPWLIIINFCQETRIIHKAGHLQTCSPKQQHIQGTNQPHVRIRYNTEKYKNTKLSNTSLKRKHRSAARNSLQLVFL